MTNPNTNPNTNPPSYASLLSIYQPNLTPYEALYRDLHQNPELSSFEAQTASLITTQLQNLGDFKIHTKLGGYGVVGILSNGPGKVVLIRAELDGLPMKEQTGLPSADLPYASKKQMVDRYNIVRSTMHACGHDMNMAALLVAAATLKAAREHWKGKLIVLFQPDQQEKTGAEAHRNPSSYQEAIWILEYGTPRPWSYAKLSTLYLKLHPTNFFSS